MASKMSAYLPEDIVKALRICRKDLGCIGCPLRGYKFCISNMEKAAADLIEEQLREIERLQNDLILKNDELLKLREENRWIPVGEQLPEEFVSVLVCIPSENPLPTVKEAYLANGAWATKMAIFFMEEVSHWKPMPKGVEVQDDA